MAHAAACIARRTQQARTLPKLPSPTGLMMARSAKLSSQGRMSTAPLPWLRGREGIAPLAVASWEAVAVETCGHGAQWQRG